MIKWELTYEDKPYTLYFDDETHTYFLEGEDVEFQPVLSTTQVIHFIFPKKYEGIDTEVLKKAAERGTKIHDTISDYELKGIEPEIFPEEFRNYLKIKSYYCMKILESEQPILLKVGDNWIAGRYDLLTNVKDLETEEKEVALVDIKTTSTLDLDYLKWQLGIYRLGIEKTTKYKIKSVYGLHLRKDKRKLQKVVMLEDEKIMERLEKILK